MSTVTTKPQGVAADYDAGGRLPGIDMLDAMKRSGDPAVFEQVVLQDMALRRFG